MQLWRATGMKDDDFQNPIIAVVNSFTQFVPGHAHPKDLGQLVAREIEAASNGAIALVDNGDFIGIDIPNRSINVALYDEALSERRATMDTIGSKVQRATSRCWINLRAGRPPCLRLSGFRSPPANRTTLCARADPAALSASLGVAQLHRQ